MAEIKLIRSFYLPLRLINWLIDLARENGSSVNEEAVSRLEEAMQKELTEK